MKIAVIGAGIIGTMTAYEFARRGHRVAVFDREAEPAMKCSHANGAQISVCNAQTWNTWTNVAKGLKWMLRKDAPLLIRPTPSIKKIAWIAGFLRHTMNGTHVRNTIETIELAKLSSSIYEEIIGHEGLEFDQSKCGMLHVYSDSESLDAAMGHRELLEGNGVQWKYVSREDVLKQDSALRTFKNLQGGILTASDWTGDPYLFCNALRKILSEKYRTRFFFNAEVKRIRRRTVQYNSYLEGGFDAIVLANGHEIVNFASGIGDWLNIYPVKGYSVTIDGVGAEAPHISLLDDAKKIVSSRLGNRLRIAGTAELAGENYDLTQSRIDPLLKWCNENFPDVDTSAYTPWACLRPMNSNMMPIWRQSLEKGIWYHGGHGHLGWTTGAGTARLLVNEIEDKNDKKFSLFRDA